MTNYIRKIFTISDMQQGKAERLSDYVSRVMKEKGFSGYQVEENAHKAGYKIDQSYINRIKNDYVKNPSSPKLIALAAGLQEPEETVFGVARGVSLEPTEFDEKVKVALLGAKDFTEEQKEELVQAVRRFVSGIRAENTQSANS